MTDRFTIHQGDSLAILAGLPAGSVDAIITDPPYGVNFQSCWVEAERRKDVIANDDAPFIWFLRDAFTVAKPGAPLVCFCEWRHQEAFRFAMEIAGFSVKAQGIWDRCTHGMGDLRGNLAPAHDVFWFATKGNGFEFNGARPPSVLHYPKVPPNEAEHPTQKPVDLMRHLVRVCSKPGSVILDPFAGSGTTGVAALLEGRSFIGCELSEHYAAIARKRCGFAAQQGTERSIFDPEPEAEAAEVVNCPPPSYLRSWFRNGCGVRAAA